MRKLAVLVLTLGLCFGLCACGYGNGSDGNVKIIPSYTYDYAYIELQNGEIVEGEVKQWSDCGEGMVQIKLENGDIYLTHGCNVTLINKND